MSPLSRDFQQLQQHVAASGLAASFRLVSVDGGTVSLRVMSDNRRISCTIFFVNGSDYPHSPLMAMCEDDDKVNSALEAFGDEFEYGAPLLDVISRLCTVLHLDAGIFDQLRAGSADQSDEEAASEEDYSDNGQDMAETDNQELMERVLKKVSIWHKLESEKQKTEDEGLAAEGSQSFQSLSMEEQLAQKRQIFAPQEAYKMLANELEKLMMEPIDGVAVDAVDNNVWHWDMWLSSFSSNTPIAQGLQKLHQEHDKGHVHLQLSFKRGLHPFYPPLLDVLYPRFKGPVAGALTSHPVTQLQHWDPWITHRELVAKLKAFLEAAANVDVSSTIAALEQHQTAAYLPVERQLAKLEALSSTRPLCYAEHKKLYSTRDAGIDAQRMEALAPSAKRSKTDGPDAPKRAWAAGTGYGMDRMDNKTASSIWDAKQAEASQAARDAELEELLGCMASGLQEQLGNSASEPSSSAAGSSAAAEQAIRRWSGAQASTSGNDSYTTDASIKLCVTAVQGSCLLPFLHSELAHASFNDMASRASYYTTMLSVIWQLCSPATADILAMPMQPSDEARQAGTSGSIHDLMTGLEKSAVRFRQVMGPQAARNPAPPPAPVRAGVSLAATAQGRAAAAAASEAAEEQQSLDLADFILALSDRVKHFKAESPAGCRMLLATLCTQGKDRTAIQTRSTWTVAGRRGRGRRAGAHAGANDEQVYTGEMRILDQVEFDEDVKTGHSYANKVASEGVAPRSRQARIGKELAGLAASLPLTLSSSVFVRVDQTHMTLWKALITGPEGTPYSGGCFEFDIYYPPSYPQVAMNVLLKTTGGSSVRFNPNLYNCGKVCLSLLGTWSGAKGETWDASSSTTLQMLVSIQSLILVPDPYFNEPGYEGSMHTPAGRAASKAYDRNIREQTLHWAIFQALKSPPLCFKDIVKKHFHLRQDNIVATCTEWIKEARDDGDKKVADRMEQYLQSFRELVK